MRRKEKNNIENIAGTDVKVIGFGNKLRSDDGVGPVEIEKLEKLAEDLPTISKGHISEDILVGGESLIGDFDFSFEWKQEPTEKLLRRLIL